jgi:hypothetical protein
LFKDNLFDCRAGVTPHGPSMPSKTQEYFMKDIQPMRYAWCAFFFIRIPTEFAFPRSHQGAMVSSPFRKPEQGSAS